MGQHSLQGAVMFEVIAGVFVAVLMGVMCYCYVTAMLMGGYRGGAE